MTVTKNNQLNEFRHELLNLFEDFLSGSDLTTFTHLFLEHAVSSDDFAEMDSDQRKDVLFTCMELQRMAELMKQLERRDS